MQKNAFPRTESRKNASRAVGRSVSRPSTPRDLWWVKWYGFEPVSSISTEGKRRRMILLGVVITDSEGSAVRQSNRDVGKDGK